MIRSFIAFRHKKILNFLKLSSVCNIFLVKQGYTYLSFFLCSKSLTHLTSSVAFSSEVVDSFVPCPLVYIELGFFGGTSGAIGDAALRFGLDKWTGLQTSYPDYFCVGHFWLNDPLLTSSSKTEPIIFTPSPEGVLPSPILYSTSFFSLPQSSSAILSCVEFEIYCFQCHFLIHLIQFTAKSYQFGLYIVSWT